jgi:hypothetical protein
MKKLVEAPESAVARDFLTKFAYRPIIALEQRLTNKLEIMYNRGQRNLTFEQLQDMVGGFARDLNADILDADAELDFLIRANKERLIEVTLASDKKTQTKISQISKNQLSLFGDNE